MKATQVKSIVILGGGSAGWMTAASLIHAAPKHCKITLVESEEIGTVGVGEATIPPIKQFNQRLGIDENAFLKATKGTFKLGIEFVDWTKKGHSYCHPFGQFGADFDSLPLYHYWLKAKSEGDHTPLDHYSMAWMLGKENKFDQPLRDPRYMMSTFDYAYHFDAALYAHFLKERAMKQGVKRKEGIVKQVDVNQQTQTINHLVLETGEVITGDFFVDCSGFRGILIEEALYAGYQDWRHYLPVDSAVAVPCEHGGELSPYTRSTAREAGWQWRIPLQHRVGNGYVYCSKFISDESATSTLMESLEGRPLAEPKIIRFKTGRRNQMWKGNCVAIGLSAGFLEPLESTALHLIQTSINRLISLFPVEKNDQLSATEYNRITLAEYDVLRDFIILHYHATQRDDSPLWQKVSSMDIPERLAYKLAQFKHKGHIVYCEDELFKRVNWLAVLVGQEVMPKTYDPIVDMREHVDYKKILKEIKHAIDESVKRAPTHQQYIDKFCKSDR
ncbi:tryptophan halogenase family protein [Microbulbifer spongiae]|uniref:Tryptophan 7-halogenase n=1 Tax=Microbulbifer spongiae TaxID=2944933 RepID=A0ABY9EEP0_9GAMM|nr:tryptophan halogenase family protein [Microbulbifer sp. MI-G]WKD50461.1 tryptophan 7-halogenase [Microbulbifer sp. MI-G]